MSISINRKKKFAWHTSSISGSTSWGSRTRSKARRALSIFPFWISHRGDSGQNQIKTQQTKGMAAWSIVTVFHCQSYKARFRWVPKAVYDVTSAPTEYLIMQHHMSFTNLHICDRLSVFYISCQNDIIRPRTSGWQISPINTGPAGKAMPWPIPKTILPPMKANYFFKLIDENGYKEEGSFFFFTCQIHRKS